MLNLITDNFSNFADSAIDVTNFALGRERDQDVHISKSAGILVGSATALACVAIFGTMAVAGTLALASNVPPIVPAIGAVGLALTPVVAKVAGTTTEIGTEILLDQLAKN